MYLIAIDPGACTGYACFRAAELVHAGTCSAADQDFWRCIPRFDRCTSLQVWIERPTVYPQGQQKGDPNDLITLAISVGELSYHYRLNGAIVTLVQPRTWKGQVPKDIHNKRVLACLREQERAVLPHLPASKYHNMIDAIGLGLYALSQRGQRCHANQPQQP